MEETTKTKIAACRHIKNGCLKLEEVSYNTINAEV